MVFQFSSDTTSAVPTYTYPSRTDSVQDDCARSLTASVTHTVASASAVSACTRPPSSATTTKPSAYTGRLVYLTVAASCASANVSPVSASSATSRSFTARNTRPPAMSGSLAEANEFAAGSAPTYSL